MATILTVEDDPGSSVLLTEMLRGLGHEVFAATGLQDGWKLLTEHVLFDIVVLDNELDGERGWDFIAQARDSEFFSSLPIVVYTGYSDRKSVVKYISLKIQNYIVKPYEAKKLAREIDKAQKLNWRSGFFYDAQTTAAMFNMAREERAVMFQDAASRCEQLISELEAAQLRNDFGMIGGNFQELREAAEKLGCAPLQEVSLELLDLLAQRRYDQLRGPRRRLYMIWRLLLGETGGAKVSA